MRKLLKFIGVLIAFVLVVVLALGITLVCCLYDTSDKTPEEIRRNPRERVSGRISRRKGTLPLGQRHRFDKFGRFLAGFDGIERNRLCGRLGTECGSGED